MVCHIVEDDTSQEEARHTLYEQGRRCAISSIRFLRTKGEWTRAKHQEWLAYYTRRWRGYQHTAPHNAHWSAGMVTVLKSSYALPYSTDVQSRAEREREPHFASRSPLLFFDGARVHVWQNREEPLNLACSWQEGDQGTKLVPRDEEHVLVSYACLTFVLLSFLYPPISLLLISVFFACLLEDVMDGLLIPDHHLFFMFKDKDEG